MRVEKMYPSDLKEKEWDQVLKELVKTRRIQSGRNEHPSLLIIDSQSVKTTGKGEQRGFDGGKKNQGT